LIRGFEIKLDLLLIHPFR